MAFVMGAIVRSWNWIGIACIAALVLSVAPVSRLVLNPQAVDVDGQTVSVARSFPGDALGLPRPRISYVETVTPLTKDWNDGHFCQQRGGPTRYTKAGEVGRWRIPWAASCVSDPAGFTWEACWHWHVGVFKMGAVCLSRTFLGAERK